MAARPVFSSPPRSGRSTCGGGPPTRCIPNSEPYSKVGAVLSSRRCLCPCKRGVSSSLPPQVHSVAGTRVLGRRMRGFGNMWSGSMRGDFVNIRIASDAGRTGEAGGGEQNTEATVGIIQSHTVHFFSISFIANVPRLKHDGQRPIVNTGFETHKVSS